MIEDHYDLAFEKWSSHVSDETSKQNLFALSAMQREAEARQFREEQIRALYELPFDMIVGR